MFIYRAMCKEEYLKTVELKRPHFRKRYKWFSYNKDWIEQRVQDNLFNNSKFKRDRYDYLCEFEWDGIKDDFTYTNEIQFDTKRNPNIRFVRLVSIK